MIGPMLLSFGMLMLLLGFAIVALGMLAAVSQQKRPEYEQGVSQPGFGVGGNEKADGKVKGGGVILIGPIPIIFGTDRRSTEIVIMLAIILMFLTYLLFR
ncbi:MAG: DUF131 domain-containing protein [Methanosarcinaceae archaeon]|nr:DUF131 domain-containing protein [Methanosarcinaceae archaeon]